MFGGGGTIWYMMMPGLAGAMKARTPIDFGTDPISRCDDESDTARVSSSKGEWRKGSRSS